MNQPIFKTYCENMVYCRIARIKLQPAGDGYKQICPACGWVWDPEAGMTVYERNQYLMNSEEYT